MRLHRALVTVLSLTLGMSVGTPALGDTAEPAKCQLAHALHHRSLCVASRLATPLSADEIAKYEQHEREFVASGKDEIRGADSGDVALGILICFLILILIAAAASADTE